LQATKADAPHKWKAEKLGKNQAQISKE